MKIFDILLCIALVIFPLKSWPKSGNGWVSSGGDDLPFGYGSSWFNNIEGTIPYCIKADPNYSIKQDILEKMIENSISKWKKYYYRFKFFDESRPQEYLGPNFNYKVNNKCTKTAKIFFIFNIEDQNIKKLKPRYQNPFSFASFDNDNKKGYIWFSDLKNKTSNSLFRKIHDENLENAIEALIMHELGHTFGVPHINGTIMREDIVGQLDNPFLKTSIDGQAFLDFGFHKNFEAIGTIPPNQEGNPDSSIFKKFTGFPPRGKISARMHTNRDLSKIFDGKIDILFEIADEKDIYKIKINKNLFLEVSKSQREIFRHYDGIKNSTRSLGYRISSSYIYSSEVIDSSGNHIPIIIDLNNVSDHAEYSFAIRYLDKSKKKYVYLFGGKP